MKISIFLTNAIATTVLLTFLPYHESDALSFEGIKNKTTGKIIFRSNTRVCFKADTFVVLELNMSTGFISISIFKQMCSNWVQT